jgi:hypothetical protein
MEKQANSFNIVRLNSICQRCRSIIGVGIHGSASTNEHLGNGRIERGSAVQSCEADLIACRHISASGKERGRELGRSVSASREVQE